MSVGTNCSLVIAALIIAWAIATTPAREIRACVATMHALADNRYVDASNKGVNATFELQCRGVK